MSFTGNEDHSITLAEASAWTANYRETIPAGDTLGNYFGGEAISAILAQTDCVGMRIYYAIDDNGKKQLVICGVDASGNDLYTGLLAERSIKNPPFPVSANPLNS